VISDTQVRLRRPCATVLPLTALFDTALIKEGASSATVLPSSHLSDQKNVDSPSPTADSKTTLNKALALGGTLMLRPAHAFDVDTHLCPSKASATVCRLLSSLQGIIRERRFGVIQKQSYTGATSL